MPPIRDQDSVGWCYAFASADLLNHYLYKKSKDRSFSFFGKTNYLLSDNAVSALGVSGAYNIEHRMTFYDDMPDVDTAAQMARVYNRRVIAEGGSIHLALKAAKKRGICFEKELRSENYRNVKDTRCAKYDSCSINEVMNIIYDQAGNRKTCDNFNAIQAMLPTMNLKQIETILSYSEKNNALNRLIDVQCHKPVDTNILGFSTDRPAVESYLMQGMGGSTEISRVPTKDKLFEKIDQALDRGSPVGITYFSSFLTRPQAAPAAMHASSLVGKSFNPVTCEVEYILRNSWGASCGSMVREHPQYKNCVSKKGTGFQAMRQCRAQFPPQARNPKIRCENSSGYLFIPKSELSNYVVGASSLAE